MAWATQEAHEMWGKQHHWRRTQWGMMKVWWHRPRKGCFRERSNDCWVCTGMCMPGVLVGPWYRELWESYLGRSIGKWRWVTSSIDCRLFPKDVHEEAKRDRSMWGIAPGRKNNSHYSWLHEKDDLDWGSSWMIFLYILSLINHTVSLKLSYLLHMPLFDLYIL